VFSHVVRLKVDTPKDGGDWNLSLVPFHNFSPVLKYLQVDYCIIQLSQIFALVCSLPLLEDLSLDQFGTLETHQSETDFQPSIWPPLTGTLRLGMVDKMEPTASRLLALPGGFRFRKLVIEWRIVENLQWINALVARCADTLECIDIRRSLFEKPWPASINFSEATKLKDVIFRWGLARLPHITHMRWAVKALETITSKHRDLQHISIGATYLHSTVNDPASLRQAIGEENYEEWMEFDRLLVRFWESRGIRTKIVYSVGGRAKQVVTHESARYLLPEVTARGAIELVDSQGGNYREVATLGDSEKREPNNPQHTACLIHIRWLNLSANAANPCTQFVRRNP